MRASFSLEEQLEIQKNLGFRSSSKAGKKPRSHFEGYEAGGTPLSFVDRGSWSLFCCGFRCWMSAPTPGRTPALLSAASQMLIPSKTPSRHTRDNVSAAAQSGWHKINHSSPSCEKAASPVLSSPHHVKKLLLLLFLAPLYPLRPPPRQLHTRLGLWGALPQHRPSHLLTGLRPAPAAGWRQMPHFPLNPSPAFPTPVIKQKRSCPIHSREHKRFWSGGVTSALEAARASCSVRGGRATPEAYRGCVEGCVPSKLAHRGRIQRDLHGTCCPFKMIKDE